VAVFVPPREDPAADDLVAPARKDKKHKKKSDKGDKKDKEKRRSKAAVAAVAENDDQDDHDDRSTTTPASVAAATVAATAELHAAVMRRAIAYAEESETDSPLNRSVSHDHAVAPQVMSLPDAASDHHGSPTSSLSCAGSVVFNDTVDQTVHPWAVSLPEHDASTPRSSPPPSTALTERPPSPVSLATAMLAATAFSKSSGGSGLGHARTASSTSAMSQGSLVSTAAANLDLDSNFGAASRVPVVSAAPGDAELRRLLVEAITAKDTAERTVAELRGQIGVLNAERVRFCFLFVLIYERVC
jgi:hypothetical protein